MKGAIVTNVLGKWVVRFFFFFAGEGWVELFCSVALVDF